MNKLLLETIRIDIIDKKAKDYSEEELNNLCEIIDTQQFREKLLNATKNMVAEFLPDFEAKLR